jgi:hypothetical protein
MTRVVLLSLLLPLLVSDPGTGSPMTGKRNLKAKVAELGNFQVEEKFRGGERACVIVMGDHKPVVNLGLFIYDQKGTLVTRDEGGGDIVAVIWYPPRDATYKIKIHNPGREYNDCYISFK